MNQPPTKDHRLDDISRTERYFTATLLGSLLRHDHLRGVCKCVEYLCCKKQLLATPFTAPQPQERLKYKEIQQESERLQEIEVITELNAIRDYKVYYPEEQVQEPLEEKVQELVENETQSMPDIVIRYRDSLVVIEAKFFGLMPSDRQLKAQITLQKEMIYFIGKRYPGLRRFSHVYLGPPCSLPDASTIGCDACITWRDILEFAELLGENDYVVARLCKAVNRWTPHEGPCWQLLPAETKARPVINALIEEFGVANIEPPLTVPGKLTLKTINPHSFTVRLFSRHANDGVSLLYTTANAIAKGLVYLPKVDYLEKYFPDQTTLLDDYSRFLKELSGGRELTLYKNHYQALEKQLDDRKEEFAKLAKRFAGVYQPSF